MVERADSRRSERASAWLVSGLSKTRSDTRRQASTLALSLLVTGSAGEPAVNSNAHSIGASFGERCVDRCIAVERQLRFEGAAAVLRNKFRSA